MASQKVNFINQQGYALSAKLELPVDQHPIAYAIFAHCFTCNKNLSAIRNISRALNLKGIAVLRFDFTGLGESEGEFEDTNFTSNIDDLIAAADFLKENYKAPELLVGHSLGGAAVICAGHELASVKAIATIGAPFDPFHVHHLIQDEIETIEKNGVAKVAIGGRPFTVKKQFLDDIKTVSIEGKINALKKGLVILHAPQDLTVSIENAAKIYHAARHPKSFISLDGADHLLSNKADSSYAGEMIASWASRYLNNNVKNQLSTSKQVAVRIGDEKGFTTEIMARHHGLTADEPASIGGNDFGPTPYELVAAGLGACTAMTLKMYAKRKKWPLEEVTVHLKHYKDYAQDKENCEDSKSKIDHFDREIEIRGPLSPEQENRLLEMADRCPVHRTLEGDIVINTNLIR